MTVVARPFPPAMPHGQLREVLPGIHFVTGTIGMPGPLPVRFSRNMTILREGERLVLVNSVRLSDEGLAALARLGKVTDVIRLAANHGMDDPFYADRYGARVWAVKGQRYTAGFNTNAPQTYFAPHVEMDETTKLPLEGARLYVIHSQPAEALLLLERDGGVCISGDCLQHWHRTDAYFSWLGSAIMRVLGFIKPHNIGPGWLRQGKPPKEDLRGILGLPFDHVLPSHGEPVMGGAVEKYRPAIDRISRQGAEQGAA
jgi:hypothetical protein